jgi:hypothetical protein
MKRSLLAYSVADFSSALRYACLIGAFLSSQELGQSKYDYQICECSDRNQESGIGNA